MRLLIPLEMAEKCWYFNWPVIRNALLNLQCPTKGIEQTADNRRLYLLTGFLTFWLVLLPKQIFMITRKDPPYSSKAGAQEEWGIVPITALWAVLEAQHITCINPCLQFGVAIILIVALPFGRSQKHVSTIYASLPLKSSSLLWCGWTSVVLCAFLKHSTTVGAVPIPFLAPRSERVGTSHTCQRMMKQ